MTTTPIVVTSHHLNLTGQNVLTFVSWALTIILLAVTIEMGRPRTDSWCRSVCRSPQPCRSRTGR